MMNQSEQWLSVTLVVVLAASVHVACAEEIGVSGQDISGPILSRTIYPGPDRRIELTVRKNVTKSPHSDWNDTEATSFNLAIRVGGSSADLGFIIRGHKNGDVSYRSYEGRTTAIVVEDNLEASWGGTWRNIGGTGKFSNLKGSGTYSGHATSATYRTTTWEGEIEY